MSEMQKPGVPATIGVRDIIYVVFRHKGKIALIFLLGVFIAVSLRFTIRPQYESEAKLLIKYVVEGRSTPQIGANQSTVQPADDSGQSVINTELEILSSSDLALQVADSVGPLRILAGFGGGSNRFEAASIIQNPKNLITESPRKSTVIRVAFRHPDPGVAQAVVSQLIDSYIKKHAEIHRGGGFDEFLIQETDQLHSQLIETEDALRKEKSKLGILSVDQAKKFQDEQISKIREKLLDAQAQLAEKEAAFAQLCVLTNISGTVASDSGTMTNTVVPTAPPEKIAEYKQVCALLDTLRKQEQERLLIFKPASSVIKELRERILANQMTKKQLEAENPALLAVKLPDSKPDGTEVAVGSQNELMIAKAEIHGLRARINSFQNEIGELQKAAEVLAASESPILDLQRRKAMEEGYYSNFSESLEQSHINERLGAGKISNISIIQSPSPPGRVASKLHKMMAMALVGGLLGGVGLAFLLEFILDRSIKRPIDVETKIGLPFFLAIPRLSMNGKSRMLGAVPNVPLLASETEAKPVSEQHREEELDKGTKANGVGHELVVAPWDAANKLRPFSEALRDRLISYFEMNNLTHKPKLVAVTSCGQGAGVSTVASGLAASLSETGEGNVLLVDMNALNGSAHHFYKGDLSCSIDEALEEGKRESAMVKDNLYVVSESPNTDQMQSVLPRRFRSLVPRLKASDFDYIVFDMPSVSQISVTPRLARFMDMVLLVIESEKTDLDIVRRASSLLKSSNANVGTVLNKARNYVPRWLQQEM